MNFRWLFATCLVALLGLGGAYGYWWHINRPEYLLASAQAYYSEGERLRDANPPGSKMAFEHAEKQLQTLLSEDKDPTNVTALALRGKVLKQLASLHAKEEAAGTVLPPDRSSRNLAWAARNSIDKVCLLDPFHAEAPRELMMEQLYRGNIAGASPYAHRLVQIGKHQSTSGPWPTYVEDQVTAHYVIAWNALHNTAPRPEQALEHLRSIQALQQAESTSHDHAQPRWRLAALEAQALAIQAQQYREATLALRPDKKDPATPLQQLQARFPSWLARVREELKEPLPGEMPRTPQTIAAMAVRASPTDTPALLDLLILAVAHAAELQQLLERAELTVQVCEKLLSGPTTPELVLREVASHLAQMPDAVTQRAQYLVRVEKLPNPELAKLPAWVKLRERINRVAELALDKGTDADPVDYLHLARSAQHDGRHDSVVRYVAKGLDALARQQKLLTPKSDESVRQRLQRTEAGLHAVAAWSHLLRQEPAEADKHLEALRQSADRAVLGQYQLIEGLRALDEGRLAQAVKLLEAARQISPVGDRLYPYLGLAHAYLGLGQPERALVQLEKVGQFYAKYEQLSDDERAFAERLLPGPAALQLELCRCHLALGNVREALALKEQMQGQVEALTAAALLVDWYSRRGAALRTEDAAASQLAFEAARAELAAARKSAPDNVRLLLSEAELLRRQGDQDQAEALVRQFAQRSQTLQAGLLAARWLHHHGKAKEADQLLDRLLEQMPMHRHQIQLERAGLLAARGESQELSKLLTALEGDSPADVRVDVLGAFYAMEIARDSAKAEQKLQRLLSRSEQGGLVHFWQGRMAQNRQDYRQAAHSFAKALEYTSYRGLAQRGLLAGLLALAGQESPREANTLAATLLRTHTDEPVLLLAYAETALQLDNIHGESGMEGALKALEAALRERGKNPADGAYLLARGWHGAGRPDLARRELERALRADPKHVPSLSLAVQLSLTSADWEGLLAAAQALQACDPRAAQPRTWQAVALTNRGQLAAARRIYEELTRDLPDHPAGYLGLAEVEEKSGNVVAALDVLGRYRHRKPEEVNGLVAQIRILARSGRRLEAERTADAGVSNILKGLQETLQAEARTWSSDRSNEDVEKQVAARKNARANQEVALILAVAGAYQAAEALDLAETWTRRALALAAKLSDADRPAALSRAELFLADLAVQRSEKATSPEARKAAVDQAIDLYAAVWQRQPGHPVAGNNLAWLLNQERKEPEKALAIMQQVRTGRYSKKLVSGDRLPLDLLDTFGAIYHSAKQYEEGIALFKEAVKRYADEPRVFLHLGRLYGGLQQRRLALDYLNKATRLATEKAERTTDPQRKAVLLALAAEAQADGKQLLRK